MSNKYLLRFTVLAVLLALGVWLVARPTQPQAESATHSRAVRQSLAPASDSMVTTPSTATDAPIYPVVVNLQDIPAGVYDPNNLYDRWQRGEVDLDESEYRVSTAEAAALQAAALQLPADAEVQQAPTGLNPLAPTPGVAFDSLDITECCGGGGSVPPDPEMAAGPNHLIAVVNLAFEIYDKSGNSLVGPTTFSSFFAGLAGCNNEFDPNVVYDEEADRWMMGVDGDGTHYCAAVSQTGDPTGLWTMYLIPAQPRGGEFHDYPHAGVGDNYIVMGGNQFGGAVPGGFEGRLWALDKSVMYAGGALTPITVSTGSIEGTPQPLHLHGFLQGTWPNLGSTHYFVTDPYDGCTLNVWRWNIPTAPSIVATYNLCTATGVTAGMPVNFPQLGGNSLQGNDFRMRGFEYRNGVGWIADSVSCNPGGGTVDCVRWTEVDLTANPPTLTQAGVYASAGVYRVFPDLAVNHCDDVAVGYTKGSSSTYPAVWYTGRQSSDPVGTLQAEALLKAGEATYTSFDTPPYRWGDYTGMTIDPDGLTFWYLGEYSKNVSSFARWGTYIGSFTYATCQVEVTPAIEVSPESVSGTQLPDVQATWPVTISNVGTGDLLWEVVESATATPACDGGDVPWVATSPITGTTGAGNSSPVDVTFDSTGLAAGVYTGTLCINSNDPTTPLVSVPLTMTVENVYGLQLVGDMAATGDVDTAVSYTLTLTNTGTTTDTYDLTVTDNTWVTTAPSSVTVAAGESAQVVVTVEIPADAADGAMDGATVTAVSPHDLAATDSVTLTTTAHISWWYLYLPIAVRP